MLIENSLKPSTRMTYISGWNKFLEFCKKYNQIPLPASEDTLIYFVAHLHSLNLKGSSTKVYLSAIRNQHIVNNYPNPTLSDRLNLALRGASVMSTNPDRKHPITYSLLCKLCDLSSIRHDSLLLKTAMTLAFFGCLRSGEFCIPNSSNFDLSIHLTLDDIQFLPSEPIFKIHLKRSKTDKLNTGIDIFVGCSGTRICAFCFMQEFCHTRLKYSQNGKEPLFLDQFGSYLTKPVFIDAVKLLVSITGRDPKHCSGHSGSATTANENEFETHEVKQLGRWRSEAYNIYLRNPKVCAKFARRLATSKD